MVLVADDIVHHMFMFKCFCVHRGVSGTLKCSSVCTFCTWLCAPSTCDSACHLWPFLQHLSVTCRKALGQMVFREHSFWLKGLWCKKLGSRYPQQCANQIYANTSYTGMLGQGQRNVHVAYARMSSIPCLAYGNLHAAEIHKFAERTSSVPALQSAMSQLSLLSFEIEWMRG